MKRSLRYLSLAAPGYLKIWGAVLLLAPLPLQYLSLPKAIEMQRSAHALHEKIDSKINKFREMRDRILSSKEHLNKVLNLKTNREDNFSINEYIEIKHNIREFDSEFSKDIKFLDQASIDIKRITNSSEKITYNLRLILCIISSFGGFLIFIGSHWENDRKVEKELREIEQ